MDGIVGAGAPGIDKAASVRPELVELIVEGDSLAEAMIVPIRVGDRLGLIVEAVAVAAGYAASETFLFVEEEVAPLDIEILLHKDHPHRRKHHVHRARELEVVVFYSGLAREKRFPPATTVASVLAWSTKAFNIDATMAPEFELALVGTTDELDKSSHIGRLTKHPSCRVEMNLVRGVVPNGGSA